MKGPFDWFVKSKAADHTKSSDESSRAASASASASPSPSLSHSQSLDSDVVCFIDEIDSDNSNPDSPFDNQPLTPIDFENSSSTMPMTSSPIDIATPTRNTSSSPSSQGKKAPNYFDPDSRTSAMMSGNGYDTGMGRSRQESFAGAKPISMNNPNRHGDSRQRRESLASSMAQGMSWGGVSVGSWIRDDIMMAGTSPFPYQSPSYHSSSYLPKLEANFMKDFACCGEVLPTLHDLLQHYEEAHAQQTPQSLRTSSAAARARENSIPNSKAAIANQASSAVQQAQHQQIPQSRPQGLQMPSGGSNVGGIQFMRQQQQSQPATPVQKNIQVVSEDMDGVEDMEMDDAMEPVGNTPDTPVQVHHQPVQMPQQSMFGQQPRPTLNLNSSVMQQHSGLRTSQPTTPSTAGFSFQNNPTVSSVNTPTLSAQPIQQQQQFSPDTSVPGSPAGEFDETFANMPMNMNMGNMNMGMGNLNFQYGMGDSLGLDLCIDEPAKRLYNSNGYPQQRQLQQQFAQFGLAQGQYGSNNDMMRLYRQQQMMGMNGMNGADPQTAAMMMMGEEHKPFRCPVIGCEKAYKNQNGLKYHKTHGHQTQQLHENGDGTFSIVNPETSTPYPGTLGMEKEKPYKCDVCGKRYKNLNGLKYHKQHSPPCNPELKLNNHLATAGLGPLGVGMGLPGIGEEGMM